MRLVMIAILSAATLGTGVVASKPSNLPFDGVWGDCETWKGASVCSYKALVQRGSRVCGVQSDFATNRFYVQRFVGTAKDNIVEIDKICGDPGSETDTYCTGQAPGDAAKVGWGASDQQLSLCGGQLHVGIKGEPAKCTAAQASKGLPYLSAQNATGPDADDRAWMASCAGGDEG